MKLNVFSDTWNGVKSENRILRLFLPMLVVSNLMLSFLLVAKDRTTVIIPQNLSEKVSVTGNASDGGYKRAWGLYVAHLIGNVTPTNVNFVTENIALITAPTLYHDLKISLARQAIEIKESNIAMDFEPQQVMYEVESDKVFVIGRSTISCSAGKLDRSTKVFEMQVEVFGGKPVLKNIDVYTDEPRTAKVMERIAKRERAEVERKMKNKESTS